MATPAVHHVRRVRRTDSWGDEYNERVPTLSCGRTVYSDTVTTTKKDKVTCKRCLAALGIEPKADLGPAPKAKKPGRPTAWDHVLEDDVPEPAPAPDAPKPEPAPQPLVPAPTPRPTTPQPAPWTGNRTAQDRLRDRIAIIFFHLMRSHLGVEQVNEIARMASLGVTGPGIWLDLEERSRALADLVIRPEHERRLPRG